ncbi:fimbrial chaperone protein [Pseudoxanthomonas sp. 3HH-4]|uniref:fimbrial biogenesis chaperone n=1 Tax=Pseudoxanthomonas sp. 3HH-4 TaxID=1690214 RepID=UPI00115247B1|nr:fimbria/pilus periplasmic chaperone [Pseudoxanthomonas sp. 3HH-4]TQM06804.1 fimbrial chaperone protein [Pseudoxanthomonas sp. 3HH-4]
MHLRRLSWLLLLLLAPIFAKAGSVLIFPVNPRIAGDEKAVAVWIENQGSAPLRIQARVQAWEQGDEGEVLTPQTSVAGSPSMMQILPGKRQMLRLIRVQPTPAGAEQAYRVLIDELDAGPVAPQANGVRLQMRYSVPLFVQGPGLGQADTRGDAVAKGLRWRLQRDKGSSYLVVRNEGAVSARLSAVGLLNPDGTKTDIVAGLLGYVHPRRQMRWKLPGAPAGSEGQTLSARINDDHAPTSIAPSPMQEE